MINLHVVAEGHSEEEFVNKVLVPYLSGFNVYVYCQRVHTGGSKVSPVKGGLGKIPKYRSIQRALDRWVEADKDRKDVYYTTMLDLYAFPMDTESPYTEYVRSISNEYHKVEKLEKAMFDKHEHPRFIPYVQLHEFETLLLADLDKLKLMYPDRKTHIDRLKREIGDTNIELINKGAQTAPSKRIITAVPEHEGQKKTVGPIVVEDIGIDLLKQKCKHFNDWIAKLERLGNKEK